MLVTIMPGPGDQFRVQELADDSVNPLTIGWFQHYDNAVDYIREHYRPGDALSPAEFRQEVLYRRTHPEVRNG